MLSPGVVHAVQAGYARCHHHPYSATIASTDASGRREFGGPICCEYVAWRTLLQDEAWLDSMDSSTVVCTLFD